MGLDQPGEVVFNAPENLVLESELGGDAFQLEDEDATQFQANIASGDDSAGIFDIDKLKGGKFVFAGKEFDLDAFKQVVDAGVNVDEKNKAATQKFQEAADLRQRIEQEVPNFELLKSVGTRLAQLPEEAQKTIFEFADQIEAQVRSTGSFVPDTAPTGKPIGNYSVPPGFKPPDELLDFNKLSDEGKAIVAAFAPYMNRLGQLEGQIGKVLPEVSDFVGQTRVEREMSAATASLKSQYGVDVSPSDLQAAVRSTGVKNPEAAWVYANRGNLASLQQQAAQAAAEKKAPSSPTGQPEWFDPKGMMADEIALRLMNGQKMKQE